MFDIGKLLEALAFAAILPGFIWVGVSMHVLHESNSKHGRFTGLFTLWPFDKEMKSNYPDMCRLGRFLFFTVLVLQAPWLLGMAVGVC